MGDGKWKPDGDERVGRLYWSWAGGGPEAPYDPAEWKPDGDERVPMKYKLPDENLPLRIRYYVTNYVGAARRFFRIGAWRQPE